MPADPALLSPWLAPLGARPSDVAAPLAAADRTSTAAATPGADPP